MLCLLIIACWIYEELGYIQGNSEKEGCGGLGKQRWKREGCGSELLSEFFLRSLRDCFVLCFQSWRGI